MKFNETRINKILKLHVNYWRTFLHVLILLLVEIIFKNDSQIAILKFQWPLALLLAKPKIVN
jgi:hypothetical protein